jgi:hypothetical protein
MEDMARVRKAELKVDWVLKPDALAWLVEMIFIAPTMSR